MKQNSKIEKYHILQYLKYNNVINNLLFFNKFDFFLIYPLSIPPVPFRIMGGAGPYPCWHWIRGEVHPGSVARQSQGYTENQPTWRDSPQFAHMLKTTATSSRHLTLTSIFLDGGRRQKCLKKTVQAGENNPHITTLDLLWCSMPIWFIF